MNYVAHLLLTYPHEEISIGNLIGDMISNRELDSLCDRVLLGVQIHRVIDHHTDNHAAMREVVKLLRLRHRKYAPVVADILLDRALVINWEEHSSIGYDDFENWVYIAIQSRIDELPVQLHNRLSNMVAHRWLHQYSSDDGFQLVLNRMDIRAQFPSDFGLAMTDFHEHHTEMKNALNHLLPDLATQVEMML